MRQRAVIAIALALNPEIIIMDEPTTALDVVVQREILAEIMALREHLHFSVIFITHDLSLLLEISRSGGDYVCRAHRGNGHAAMNSIDQPRHPYSYGLIHSFPSLHGPRRRSAGHSWLAARSARGAARLRVSIRAARLPSGLHRLICPAATPADRRGGRSRWPAIFTTARLNAEPPNELSARACILANAVCAARAEGERFDVRRSASDTPRCKRLRLAEPDLGEPFWRRVHLRKVFPLRRCKLLASSARRESGGGCSLALRPGRATALVGESGSGKTTIARHAGAAVYANGWQYSFQRPAGQLTRSAEACDVSAACAVDLSRPVCLAESGA